MGTRFSMIALAAVVVVLSLAPPAVAGQSSTAPAKAWEPPRTPDGQPDIQGFWADRADGTPTCDLETGWCEERHTAVTGIQGANPKSVIVDPPTGKLPYQAAALVVRNQHMAHHGNPRPEDIDPQVRCFCGVPRLNYQSNYQIFQPPGYVVFNYEREGHRIIALDPRPHPGDNVKLEKGNSRGHWEGNTLVVDVTNFNDWSWFDVLGDYHSDAMTLVERYTFVGPDTIEYQVTVDDPKVFTRPWTIAFPIGRNKQKNYEQWEWACREGERSLEHMLSHPSDGPDEAWRSPGRPGTP